MDSDYDIHYSNLETNLHDKLMGSGDQGKSIAVVEGFRYVLSKGVSSSSGGDAPATSVVRVGPQQVAHWALEWFDRQFNKLKKSEERNQVSM